jgi:hypothetical protein
MAKNMKINLGNEQYTLEFTRATIKRMERAGFRIDEIASQPVTMTEMLFKGAFQAHHSALSDAKLERVYDAVMEKAGDGFLSALVSLYTDVMNATVSGAQGEHDEGNAMWEVQGE